MLLPALVLAAAMAGPAPAPLAARLETLRARYRVLWAEVNRSRVQAPAVRNGLFERVGVAAQTIDALANEPDADVLADLERRADLDEQTVPALLGGPVPELGASPGAHVGIARAGDHDEPFAYWIPRGYDARKPPPLVALLHGATQPETDLVARVLPRSRRRERRRRGAALARRRGARARARCSDRHPPALRRRAFERRHLRVPCRRGAGRIRGLLGIAGFMRPEDARAVGLRLAREGAYLVVGAGDTVIGTAAVRANVRVLRAAHVYARYYEVPRAPHALRPLYAMIAKAWNDMLRGVTTLENDGLGSVTDT